MMWIGAKEEVKGCRDVAYSGEWWVVVTFQFVDRLECLKAYFVYSAYSLYNVYNVYHIS